MWLLKVFSPLSRLALRTYYRLRTAGARVPASGPLLLVANHPNSLLDPAAVCAVAGRPVRFLAKAPLFDEPIIGRLVRASGAIPVHRRQDDPSLMDRNEETFRAAYEALAGGDAVGVFPEGTSHSEPRLVPLRTGAARIALGARSRCGGPFPILPVGLVLPEKDRFRSRALIVVGEPVPWADLAAGDADDREAVRALTSRIEESLRCVTVNLERWEDAPVVECAEGVYAAEFHLPRDPLLRLERLRQVSEALTRLRRNQPRRLEPVYRALERYAELLAALGLRPHVVHLSPTRWAALRWTVEQLAFFLLVAPLAALGTLVFWLPYRVTGLLPERAGAEKDVRSTFKLLGGILVYGAWILALAGIAAWRGGPLAGAATALLLPLLGLLTMVARDRWRWASRAARRHLLLRNRDTLRKRLVERRRELARQLEALRRELEEAPAR